MPAEFPPYGANDHPRAAWWRNSRPTGLMANEVPDLAAPSRFGPWHGKIDHRPGPSWALASPRGGTASELDPGWALAPPCGIQALHAPWHFLNFLPDPHQQGSLRPTLGPVRAGADEATAVAVAAPAADEVPPATAARPSTTLRAIGLGVGGLCCTVTRKMVCVTSWRMVVLSSSNIRYASILNSFSGSRCE